MITPDPIEVRTMALLRELVYPTVNQNNGEIGPPPAPIGLTFEFSPRTENSFRLEFANGTVIEAEIANVSVYNPRIE